MRRLRACRLAELAVRDHGQQFLVYRRKYLSEGDLRLPPLDRLHHADHILPGHADLRAGLPLAGFRRLGRRRPPPAPRRAASCARHAAGGGVRFARSRGPPARPCPPYRSSHRVAEIVQLAARKARQLLFGLRSRIVLIVFSICRLASAISCCASSLAFFRYLLPLGPDLRELPGIGLLQLLDLAVGQADAVALLFPVMLVAGDFTQLLLDVDMVAAGLLARRADNLLRQPDLAGDLDGERTARLARFEAEQRADILHVEHHGAVGDALGIRRIIFDIGIVGRDDAVAPFGQQAFEDGLGDGAADDRLGTRPNSSISTSVDDEAPRACSSC